MLVESIGRLHDYLSVAFPSSWRVTILDAGAIDRTADIAAGLAAVLPSVRVLHMGSTGGGEAVRTAWPRRDVAVLACVDAELSVGLDALLRLVAPLIAGQSDVAVGPRFAAMRAGAACRLLPYVERFLDTELLRLAERNGVPIHHLAGDRATDGDRGAGGRPEFP